MTRAPAPSPDFLCRACKRRIDVCTCPDVVAAGVVPSGRG